MSAEQAQNEELAAVIREIQDRVRSRHPQGVLGVGNIPVVDTMPLLHARDAAGAKVAAIGSVNPRAGGPLNWVIQAGKRLIARALDWHVRDQVEFNRAVLTSIEAALNAFEQNNRSMSELAGYFERQASELRGDIERVREEVRVRSEELTAEARELKDVRTHWAEWRTGWEEKLNRGEVYMLRTISELSAAAQHRATLTENEFRRSMREQHENYRLALDKTAKEIQERLWADLDRTRTEYEQTIQAELRVVRQRGVVQTVSGSIPSVTLEESAKIDWLRFADRFRGPEEYVSKGLGLYLERFAGASDVLDIGCGRGEFLEAAKTAGIGARGIDLSPEIVALCRSKGLDVEVADLFDYLSRQADESLGGLYCSQVIEHLQPARLPDLVWLAAAKLRRGALVAFETPNPECLAIFATHFYLDPTHVRPVPSQLMAFYLEEAGLGRIEVVRLAPAAESIPAVSELPEAIRNTFFGGMDYAIFARKL